MRIGGSLSILLFVLFPLHSLAQEVLPAGYQYVFPGPGARYVHPGTPIILRLKNISPEDLSNPSSCIKVSGEESGIHSGKLSIASDKRTLLFEPEKSFKPGEKVHVIIEPRFSEYETRMVEALLFQFQALEKECVNKPMAEDRNAMPPEQKKASSMKPAIMSNGVSVPSDFPHVNILQNKHPSEEYLFVNTTIKPYYQLIFNTRGEVLWYQKTPDLQEDFRVQANGWITMQVRDPDPNSSLAYMAFTPDFEYIKSFHPANGYSTDEHEFYMLPDSGYFMIGKRDTEVDMSQYVSGGRTDAIVTETCIQEFTAEDQLIFIWRAWDHFDIRQMEMEDLCASRIRFPHMNALFTDEDGHILLSSRHLSEISKIHRQSGDFLWRMNGIPDSPQNDFRFVNDPLNGFRNQHAIRSLGNSRYMLLDNGNLHVPPVSRVVEYEIDTVHRTATLVWEYRHDANKRIARFMGNAQRLPGGNTHINWAVGEFPTIALELTQEGEKVFEMQFENGSNCYRSFRHSWEGKCHAPYLLLDPHIDNIILIMNTFGDTQVEYFEIYGGNTPRPTTLIDTSHTTLKYLNGLPEGEPYYFRIRAVEKNGTKSEYSNEAEVFIRDTEPGSNLIVNGDFSQNLDYWSFEVDSSASALVQTGDSICHIEIQEGGDDPLDVQIIQTNIPLYQGQSYLLEFDAMGGESRIMEVLIGAGESPWTDYSQLNYTPLVTFWEHHQYAFEMKDPTDLNARLLLNVGNYEGDLYVDNVSLKMEQHPSKVLSPAPARTDFLLHPNHPNPFLRSTHIDCDLPEECSVVLTIYNALGQKVKEFIHQDQGPGRYSKEIRFNDYSTGVYYYTLEAIPVRSARSYRDTKRMVLLK